MLKKVDATEGALLKLIFIYTIPLILSAIVQNLFHIADKAVLGNMAGTVAVASISATGTITELIISGAIGLSTGTAIVLARFVGQKNNEKIKATIDTSVLLGIGLGSVVAVAGFFLAPVFLAVVKCPAECLDGALLYMRIYLAAAPANLLYNYGSSILRTLGDTQRPLIYIILSGVVNVVLNLVLCLILPKKVAAVAIATAVSSIISAFLVFRRLCRLESSYRVSLRGMRFDLEALGRIVRFGIPSTVSCLVHPIGNLQVMTAVHSYGADVIAGFSASVSVDTIPRAFANGFASATTTFMGQNIGAGKSDRVKRTFWYTLLINFLITGVIGLFLFGTGEFWIGLLIGRSSDVAIVTGITRSFYVTLFMFVYAINVTLSHALLAFGYSFITSLTNIAFNLVFRVAWMQWVYPLKPEFETIPQCFTVSWILNMLFCTVFFAFVYWRYVKRGVCKRI